MMKKIAIFPIALITLFSFHISGNLLDLSTAQIQSSSFSARLDEALQKADIERARELVLDDQDGADRLFLRYLEETITKGQSWERDITQLEKARLLADVFFRIYEFDLELGIVSYWEKATSTQKQELLPILRDHYTTFQEARRINRLMPQPIDTRNWVQDRILALAERYREVSFSKGELQTMLWASSLLIGSEWKTWQLAKELDDEVGEAWAAYYCGRGAAEGQSEFAAQHAVEAAERLHLPILLQFALTRLAWRALAHDDYKAHINYFKRGLEVIRTIPVRQTMVSKWSYNFYPGEAWYLKTLWRAYRLMDIPGGEELFERGRALSRQYGGEVGELVYLIASIQDFIRPGILEKVAAQAEQLARQIGNPGWLAAFLMAKAGGLKGTRDFSQAFAALEEAASLYKKMGDRFQYAGCLGERAFFRIQKNEFAGAVSDYEESIKIYEELGMIEHAIHSRISYGTFLQSQPKLALKFLNEALPLAEKTGDPGIIRNAYSARAKLMANDSPDQSLEDFKKELFYCERLRENNVYAGEVPVAMRLVSQALLRMGKFSEAVGMEKRRAEFARAEGLFDAEADAYYWLMTIYGSDLGEVATATEYAEKYAASLIRPGKKLTVNNYDRLASAYLSIGQPGRALEFWAKALQLAKETPAGEHLQRMVHINSARTSTDLGDYDAAIMELERENALIERTFQSFQEPANRTGFAIGGYDTEIPELSSSDGHAQRRFQSYEDPIEIQQAEWLNKMALAHALSGNIAKAAKESRQAIVLEFSTQSGTALADYYSYFTPGDALAHAGELDEAIDFFIKRRDRAREIKSLPKERESLVKLGLMYARAGRLEDARQMMLEAIRINRYPPGPQVGSLAESLLALGSLELRAGNLPRADEILVEARKRANPYDLNQLWQVDRTMAAVCVARKKDNLAKNHFELALSALEGARERLRPEEFALRFGMERLQVYDEYAAYLAGRAIERGEEDDAEKAMLVVERRRTQALWDLMALGWAGLQPDAVPEQLQRARQAEARLAAKQGILRDQFSLAPEKRNTALISQIESDLKLAKEEHNRLLTALTQGKFRFLSPSALSPKLIADARRRIGSDRVLIEYLVTDDSTYAFVLSSASLQAVLLPVGRQRLRNQVQGLLQPFYRLHSGELDLARLDFDFSTAHELYMQLVAPLEPLFGQATQILVVPDDVLHYLPMELLVDEIPEGKPSGRLLFAECEQANFLIRRFTMSYLTAAAQMLRKMEVPAEQFEGMTLLAMANPAAHQDSEVLGQEDPVRRRLRSGSYSGAFVPLPGSTDEVTRIQSFFPAGSLTVLTGPSATETNYKTLSPRAEFIHLATHAVAADDQPLYSTLILTPDGKAEEDGFLQAYEIIRSPLKAKMVVLSACETARGPLGRGEGLVGLVSAFFQAGAQSVLATQWSIVESTAELMTSFYKAMTEGKNRAEALRQAKLDTMMKRLYFSGIEVSTAHPFFWAPFVLIGSME